VFAHLFIAVAFLGPLVDPVRNVWGHVALVWTRRLERGIRMSEPARSESLEAAR